MNSLKDILKTYQENQKLIAMEHGPLPPATRDGLLSAINVAKQDNVRLKKSLWDMLGDVVSVHYCNGIDSERMEAHYCNALELYEKAAKACSPLFGNGGEFTGDHLNLVAGELRDIASKIGYSTKISLASDNTVVVGFDNLVLYIKDMVERFNGNVLNEYYIKDKLVESILGGSAQSEQIAAVILNVTEGDQQHLSKTFKTLNINPTQDKNLITPDSTKTEEKTTKSNKKSKEGK